MTVLERDKEEGQFLVNTEGYFIFKNYNLV